MPTPRVSLHLAGFFSSQSKTGSTTGSDQ